MIKNILFDMGGVIFRQDTQEAFRRFRKAGINPDYYMGEFGQKDFFLQLETGEISAGEFCRRMALATGKNHISAEDAQLCWLGFVHDVPVERLHHLITLRTKYNLSLLSNTNPFVMEFMNSTSFSSDGKPISYYFDSLFLSYEMKVCKPSIEIFTKALNSGGMNAKESLFIDDSMKNILAAKSVGMHTMYVPTNDDWHDRLLACIKEHEE